MATDIRIEETGVRPYRLSVREYLAAIDGNVFPETARLELLGGVLVEKMTKHPPHNFAVLRLSKILHRILPDPWLVSEEKPVMLGRTWYPEPDLAIVRGPDDRFAKRAPGASDIGLLIEVADSSYSVDHGLKWRRYASVRIAEYWIVNLPQRRIEVYTDPSGRGRGASYRQGSMIPEGESVPIVLDGREIGRIAVGDLLPTP